MFFEKQSNDGKHENCKNELFLKKKKKSNCMSFVKKRAEIIAGKRNKKK